MQTDYEYENKISNSKNNTPKKAANLSLTPPKSPIKMPRNITKINTTNNIKSKILTKNSKEGNVNYDKIICEKRCENINSKNNNMHNEHAKIPSLNVRLRDGEKNKTEIKDFTKIAPKQGGNEISAEQFSEGKMYESSFSKNEGKRKKDWKSWSSQEKELFYEAIANGGNFSSLQKLFKTMNDV
jgi:hypothetical protein